MESAREIAPGIHRIPALFSGSRIVTMHLLIGKTRSMLVDTGMADSPEKYLLPYFKQIDFHPVMLDYVVITHSDIDHQEGNEAVREMAPNAIFMCHNLDRSWVESLEMLNYGRYCQWSADHGIGSAREGDPEMFKTNIAMDQTFEGGETIRLGPGWTVKLIHTPGHTWGHTGVYDPRSHTFVAGEAALWNSILDEDWKPALPPTYCYVDPYLATLDRLHEIEIEQYSGAHWPVMSGNEVGDFLDESKNYTLSVERKLHDAICRAKQSISLLELIQQVKPDVGTWPAENDEMLAYPFHGNLRRLEDRGQIIRQRDAHGRVRWTAL